MAYRMDRRNRNSTNRIFVLHIFMAFGFSATRFIYLNEIISHKNKNITKSNEEIAEQREMFVKQSQMAGTFMCVMYAYVISS